MLKDKILVHSRQEHHIEDTPFDVHLDYSSLASSSIAQSRA